MLIKSEDFTQLLEMFYISNMGLSCPLNDYENGPAGTFIHLARCREMVLNPGPLPCKGSVLRLNYRPIYDCAKNKKMGLVTL